MRSPNATSSSQTFYKSAVKTDPNSIEEEKSMASFPRDTHSSINNVTEATISSPRKYLGKISLESLQGGTGAQPDEDDQLLIEVPVRLQEYVQDDYVPHVDELHRSIEFDIEADQTKSVTTINTKSSANGATRM